MNIKLSAYWVTDMETGLMKRFFTLESAREYRETLKDWKMEFLTAADWNKR